MFDEDWKKHAIGISLRMPALLTIEMVFMGYLSLKDLIDLEKFPILLHSPYLDHALYILSWMLLLSPVHFLVAFYVHLICIGCVLLSHHLFHIFIIVASPCDTWNSILLQTGKLSTWCYSLDDGYYGTKPDALVTVFLVQVLLSLIPPFLSGCKSWKSIFFIWPLLPWTMFLVNQNYLHTMVKVSHILSLYSMVRYTFNIVVDSFSKLKQAWLKMKLVLGIFGWPGVATWAQFEYQVQNLLMCCWILRFAVQLYTNIYTVTDFNEFKTFWAENYLLGVNSLLFSIVVAIPQCLTTSINLFGLAVVVAEIIKFQYFCVRSWLHWSFKYHPPDPVSGPMTGAIDGMTLLVMSLYIDLLNTELQLRFLMINYILFTIASSQFQSFFNIIDPILMGLATANNGSTWKNIRTVLISLFLLAVSGIFSYLCLFSMRSTFWVFILAYNYLNTFSLMLGSLVIYCVLTFDYVFMQGWENLEDVMFYIRGACRAVEFCITLGMCGYIMWTFYSEMTSVVGILMLALYTYYCIVQRGGKGWKIWTMRRNAARKVCSLPCASPEEIRKREDNCAICLLAMNVQVQEARTMHCGHIYHENCLKKWFYIQDKCPLCYTQFRWTGGQSS